MGGDRASHCLFNGTDPQTKDELRIVLGEHNIVSTMESEIQRKVVRIFKIITHKVSDVDKSSNDVALLKLAEPVDLFICLQPGLYCSHRRKLF